MLTDHDDASASSLVPPLCSGLEGSPCTSPGSPWVHRQWFQTHTNEGWCHLELESAGYPNQDACPIKLHVHDKFQ